VSDSVNVAAVDSTDIVALSEVSEFLVEQWELKNVMSGDTSRSGQCEILRCIRRAVERRESAETLMFVRSRERDLIDFRCGIRVSKVSGGMNEFVMVRLVSGNVRVVER